MIENYDVEDLMKILHQQFINYYRVCGEDMSLSERLLFEHIQKHIEGGFELDICGGEW